jgi:hypothetical protein
MTRYVPADVMQIIVSYFDTSDCAHMAQVNKGWNSFLYRNSVWGTCQWSPQPGMIGTFLHLPKMARHHGTPHKGCFLHWLDGIRLTLASSSLRASYASWIGQNRPCLYIHHHEFSDTLLAKEMYTSFSKVDQTYLFHRIARVQIEEPRSRYLRVLQIMHTELEHLLVAHIPRRPLLGTSTSSYDTLRVEGARLMEEWRQKQRNCIEQCMLRLRKSMHALQSRGEAPWILNERLFKDNPMTLLEGISFAF